MHHGQIVGQTRTEQTAKGTQEAIKFSRVEMNGGGREEEGYYYYNSSYSYYKAGVCMCVCPCKQFSRPKMQCHRIAIYTLK